MPDLTAEIVERYAGGELSPDALPVVEAHLRDCSRCANAVLSVFQMKRSVREAMPRYQPRRRLVPSRRAPRLTWVFAAAALVLAIGGGLFTIAGGRAASQELIDLHTTILASASPIDVVSTDRHTVKPWFEGRVPFAVDVPNPSATPYHLIGGRVVFWHGRPGAYLLVSKGAHRISLFVFESAPRVGSFPEMPVFSWQRNGLTYIAVGDAPPADLTSLRQAF